MGYVNGDSQQGKKIKDDNLRKENEQLKQEVEELKKLIGIIFATKQNMDKAVGIIDRAKLGTYTERGVYHT